MRRGWVLQLRSEENLGVRPAGEQNAFEDEDNLPLDAFVDQFMTPDSRAVEVVVLADDDDDWRRFRRWLKRRRAQPARE